MPLIPLLGSCAMEEPMPPWPRGALDPDTLGDPIFRRLLAVISGLAGDLGLITGGLLRLFRKPLAWLLEHQILKMLRQALWDADL